MSFEVKAEGVGRPAAAGGGLQADRRAQGRAVHRRGAALHRRAPARGRAHGTGPAGRPRATSSARATRSGTSRSSRTRSTARAAAWSAGRSRPRAALLRPVQKLFWNPNPMIAALSRQSDLNRFYVHLLHNLVLELSRLNLESQELRNRNLQLAGRLEALERREKTLEGMVAYRDEAARPRVADEGGPPAAGRALLRRRDRQRGARHPAAAACRRLRVRHLRRAGAPARRAPGAAALGVPAASPRPRRCASSTSRSAAPRAG